MSKMVPIHQYLTDELKKQNKTREELCKEFGISRQTLYSVATGNSKISRKLAGIFQEKLGNTSSFWLRNEVMVDDDSESKNSDEWHSSNEIAKPATFLVDSQIKSVIANGKIELTGFKTDNLSSASYDLTVGDSIVIFCPSEKKERTVDLTKQEYELTPGEVIRITTAEKFKLPINYLGRAGAISEHAKKGLFLSHGIHIDPGYKGELTFCARYDGVSKFTIFREMRILSIELIELNNKPEKSYEDYWNSLPSEHDRAINELQELLLDKITKSNCFLEFSNSLKKSRDVDTDLEMELYGNYLTHLKDSPLIEEVNELNSLANNVSLSSKTITALIKVMGLEQEKTDLSDCSLFHYCQKTAGNLIDIISKINATIIDK